MNRITEIAIAGTKYPLNFSIKATKEISDRYGEVANVGDIFTGKSMTEMMDEAIWVLAILLDQGAEYKKIVDEEEIRRFTIKELEVVLDVYDFKELKEIIIDALMAGMKREVEVEIDQKNVETTQNK